MRRQMQPRVTRRRAPRGQVMIIFGLILLVLMAITGLAVDTGVSYVDQNAEERAAAAAALAGVPYMPYGCSPTCLTGTAGIAALATAAKNGFPNGGIVNGQPIAVNVARYPGGCTTTCDPNKLTVTVSESVPTTFLSLIGFGAHVVGASDTAYYLPPLTLGQPGAQQGSTLSQLNASPPSGYYFMRTEGWATDRGQGDAYTPNPADPSNTPLKSTTDVHALSEQEGTDFGATNMPSGFNGVPNQGGYNFQIVVGSGVTTAEPFVYNAAFSPDPCTQGGPSCYHEDDSITVNDNGGTDFLGNVGQVSVMEYTLFQVNDIYNHLLDTPIAQVKVDPIDATACGTNGNNATWSAGCAKDAEGGTDGAALSQAEFNDIYHQWVNIFDPPVVLQGTIVHLVGGSWLTDLTSGDTYRLRVDTLDQNGNIPSSSDNTASAAHKGYAVEVGLTGTGVPPTTCSTCTMGAIDDLAVYTPIGITSGSEDIPLVDIDPDYAGLTVNFYVFDPGDLDGYNTNLLSVIDPDTDAPVTADAAAGQTSVPIYNLGSSLDTPLTTAYLIPPSNGDGTGQRPNDDATLQTLWCNSMNGGAGPNGTDTGEYGLNGGQDYDDCYNGEWMLYQVTIPSNYTGTSNCTSDPICGQYWGLRYAVNGPAGSYANDTFTMVVSFDGTPVHLLP